MVNGRGRTAGRRQSTGDSSSSSSQLLCLLIGLIALELTVFSSIATSLWDSKSESDADGTFERRILRADGNDIVTFVVNDNDGDGGMQLASDGEERRHDFDEDASVAASASDGRQQVDRVAASPSHSHQQVDSVFSESSNDVTLINVMSHRCDWEEEYIVDLISPSEYVYEDTILKELSNDNFSIILDRMIGRYERPIFFVSSIPECHELRGGLDDFNELMGRLVGWFEGKFGRRAVVVHVSDECGEPDRRRAEVFPWYGRAVVLRQYQCGEADTRTRKTLPLGWHTGEMRPIKLQEHHPVSKKEYSWGWAGTIKSDRKTMLNAFKSKVPNGFAFAATETDRMTSAEIHALYSKSVFVPVGKGNEVLDCFRMYSALFAGAVPVVVGESEEIRWNFSFLSSGDDPLSTLPIVFAPSWREAAEKVNMLLHEKNQEMLTKNIRDWWYNYSKRLRAHVAQMIHLV